MEAYKTIVKKDDINVEIISLNGQVASYETPTLKIIVVTGNASEEAIAWVQVLQINNEVKTVSNEGWFHSQQSLIDGLSVTVHKYQPSEEEQVCLMKLTSDPITIKCCSSGNVRCCGACCRDANTGYGCCPRLN